MKCEGCGENSGALIYIKRPRPFKLCWECIEAVHNTYQDIEAVKLLQQAKAARGEK